MPNHHQAALQEKNFMVSPEGLSAHQRKAMNVFLSTLSSAIFACTQGKAQLTDLSESPIDVIAKSANIKIRTEL